MIEYWEPRVSKEEFTRMLNLHTAPSVCESLTIPQRCELYPDWSQRCVKIMATDKKILDHIYKKLQSVLELFRRDFIAALIHAPMVKCHRRFQLKFIALSRQADLMRTTLWRKSKNDSYAELKFYTVRLTELNRNTKKWDNHRITTKGIPTQAATRPIDWSGYRYTPLAATGKLHRYTIAELDKLEEVRVLEPVQHLCTFWPDNDAMEESEYSPAPTPTFMRPPEGTRTIRRPRTRTNDIPERSEREMIGSLSDDLNLASDSPLHLGSTPFGARPQTLEEELPETRTTRRPRERPTSISRKTGELLAQTLEKNNAVPRENQPPPAWGANDANGNQSPGIDETASLPFGARPGGDKPDRSTPRVVRVPKPRSSRAPSADEAQTALSEFETRKLKRTMTQKKPAPIPTRAAKPSQCPTGDGVFGASDRLSRDSMQMMIDRFGSAFEHVRSCQGFIVMELRFGRLLYYNMTRQLAKEAIEPLEWQEHIRSESSRIFKFTEILSTHVQDVEFIADLKNLEGRDMFGTEPCFKGVTYEIKCEENVTKNPILLVMDAETHQITVRDNPEFFATVNMPCPQNTWDTRLTLTSHKIIQPNQNLGVKAIVDTISAKGDSRRPDIKFTTINADFLVKEVLVKREVRYPMNTSAMNGHIPLELVITEVHDLDVKRRTDGSNIYRATGKDLRTMAEQGRLYYTAALVPSKVNNTLSENLKLEVGATASWSAEQMMGLGIPNVDGTPNKGKEPLLMSALVSSAMTIISKIDNVGYFNETTEKIE